MLTATDDVFQQGLGHPQAIYRYAAAMAVTKRKKKQSNEQIILLIGLLSDEDVYVQQAARKSLVRMSKKDFGPLPGASDQQIMSSTRKWSKWVESKK